MIKDFKPQNLQEKIAVTWLENNGFDYIPERRYASKIVFTVTKGNYNTKIDLFYDTSDVKKLMDFCVGKNYNDEMKLHEAGF